MLNNIYFFEAYLYPRTVFINPLNLARDQKLSRNYTFFEIRFSENIQEHSKQQITSNMKNVSIYLDKFR